MQLEQHSLANVEIILQLEQIQNNSKFTNLMTTLSFVIMLSYCVYLKTIIKGPFLI